MLSSFFSFLVGVITVVWFIIHTTFSFILMLPAITFKALLPIKIIRVWMSKILMVLGLYWIGINEIILKVTQAKFSTLSQSEYK